MNFEKALQESYDYLRSDEAEKSLRRDPYWPKWHSPWWHMLLLHELGLTEKIPLKAVQTLTEVLKTHYLPVFPIKAEEIPAGIDPYRQVACFCAIGNMYQVLFHCGVDVDYELPWMRRWFLQYQLPDGGLNCDERVYTKEVPKSSIMSTLPCLEAVLCKKAELNKEEVRFLNKGAEYLVKQKLFRRVSTGEIINSDWTEIRFPRFYDYDFLRGYTFLAKWSRKSGFRIPDELTDEVESMVNQQFSEQGLKLKRYNIVDKRSYNPNDHGKWTMGEISEIPLMKAVSFDGALNEALTKQWNEVKPLYFKVTEKYEIAYKNPIKIKAGEKVTIEKRETQPEWLGWVFCCDQSGVKGWVSETYLQEHGDGSATALKNYDASELTAEAGDTIKCYYEEFGWCWCQKKQNSQISYGWIPKKILVPYFPSQDEKFSSRNH